MDTNILVYAHRRDSAFHNVAAQRIAQLAEGRASWAIPWPCVHEFLAVVTHPRAYDPPSTVKEATGQVDFWLESPSLSLIAETPVHWAALRALLDASRVVGPPVHDARIAALCQQHDIHELWSADRDFNRFPGLSVVNPLVN